MAKARLDEQRQGLNKWEMHKALADAGGKTFRIPHTVPGTITNLQHILCRHPTVYVKPVETWGGRGISRIDRVPRPPATSTSTLSFSNQLYSHSGMPTVPKYHWQQQGQQSLLLSSTLALLHHFELTYSMQPCILQQAAPLLTLDGNRPFDIRVLLQRDVDGSWVQAGHLARVGGKNAIVSNVGATRGSVLTLDQLAHQLHWTPKQRKKVQKDITGTQQTIAHTLDQYRRFHEIGLDVGIDTDLNLWLIEVNTDDALGGPSHELFAQLPDKRLYKEIQARQKSVREHNFNGLIHELQRRKYI